MFRPRYILIFLSSFVLSLKASHAQNFEGNDVLVDSIKSSNFGLFGGAASRDLHIIATTSYVPESNKPPTNPSNRYLTLFDQDSDIMKHVDIGNGSWAIAMTTDGNWTVAGSDDENLYIFHDTTLIAWDRPIPGNTQIRRVAIRNDGRYVGAGGMRFTLHDLTNSNPLRPIFVDSTTAQLRAIDFSDNGRYVACGGQFGSGNLATTYFDMYNLMEARRVFSDTNTYYYPTGNASAEFRHLSISPDGKRLAFVGWSGYPYFYKQREQTSTPIEWKPFFTLQPGEGTNFLLDTTAVIPDASVPTVNIANDRRVILGFTSPQGGRGQTTTADTGRTFIPLTGYTKAGAGDGAFIYLPDGRTRFIAEEPLSTSTPQRHKSRLVSWISFDGINWTREQGVRYQPGTEDDSIASVPAALQVADSVWRLYYVGDWYRTNGIRTALSTDWGWTWQAESHGNILRKNDIDPHPVYLSDGRIRIYHRYLQPNGRGGIAFTDGNGLIFDTTKTQILIPDSVVKSGLLLDPAVLRFPNGRVACFIGLVPPLNQPTKPKIIAAWAMKAPTQVEAPIGISLPKELLLYQNYPNPCNPSTTIRFQLLEREHVILKVFDLLGRDVATLVDGELHPGDHSVVFDAKGLPSGIYFYQLKTNTSIQQKKMLVIK